MPSRTAIGHGEAIYLTGVEKDIPVEIWIATAE